jgi:isopenicillin N synthase-like dioxygenase
MPNMSDVPTISLAELGSKGSRTTVLDRLRAVAYDLGAFLLAVGEDDQRSVDEILALSHAFFRLPQAELAEIAMLRSPHFRGYNGAGSERTRGRPDLREQLDLAPERAPRRPTADSAAYWRLQGPNQWPASLPALRPTVLAWMERARAIAELVLEALLASLGADVAALARGFTPDPYTRLKILRYPGVEAGAEDQGVGEHRDSGAVTIIAHDAAAGLQVARNGAFVGVPARRGTVAVVLGRTLEYATRGYLRAAPHRVVNPPLGSERHSVTYFFSPRLDYVVEQVTLPPAFEAASRPEALSDDEAVRGEYGVSALEVLLRSHPDVALRHHPDLRHVVDKP